MHLVNEITLWSRQLKRGQYTLNLNPNEFLKGRTRRACSIAAPQDASRKHRISAQVSAQRLLGLEPSQLLVLVAKMRISLPEPGTLGSFGQASAAPPKRPVGGCLRVVVVAVAHSISASSRSCFSFAVCSDGSQEIYATAISTYLSIQPEQISFLLRPCGRA